MQKIDTLLNFSGGLDSTYSLYTHLKANPDTILLVHHCIIKNNLNRWEQELRAVQDILSYLKDAGLTNYKYIETTVDIGELNPKPLDAQVVAFMTGVILNDPKYKDIRYSYRNTPLDEWRRVGERHLAEQQRICAVIQEVVTPVQFRYHGRKLESIQPLKDKLKLDELKELPKELVQLTFSCRNPKKGEVCGKCHTCRQLRV